MPVEKYIEIVEAPHRKSVAEKEMRYEVLLKGVFFDELYFNTRGYVGGLPTPRGTRLVIPESSITSYRKEAARLNKEFADHAATLVASPKSAELGGKPIRPSPFQV